MDSLTLNLALFSEQSLCKCCEIGALEIPILISNRNPNIAILQIQNEYHRIFTDLIVVCCWRNQRFLTESQYHNIKCNQEIIKRFHKAKVNYGKNGI